MTLLFPAASVFVHTSLSLPLSLSVQFFSEYEKLLLSENYVTKRQSLKVRTLGGVSKQASCSGAALLGNLFKVGVCQSVGFLQTINLNHLAVTAT